MIPNIWCVGRNYADHAKELGNAVPPTPLIFLKAGSCAQFSSMIELPSWAEEVHHEVELALRFGPNLRIDGAAVALDLTERRVQSAAKSKGEPWTRAKSFRGACPLSDFKLVRDLSDFDSLDIALAINNDIRQIGNTRDFIFSASFLVEHVLQYFPVMPGDILLTGTPAGVGPLNVGDRLRATLDGKIQISKEWVVKESPLRS